MMQLCPNCLQSLAELCNPLLASALQSGGVKVGGTGSCCLGQAASGAPERLRGLSGREITPYTEMHLQQ